MKVLFAVNDEKDAEAITRVYQKEYKEIISSKTVYYFNAIIKELQKDKTYDRIVISEDLELFTSDNYQAVDKFIFEKMDAISDEATNLEGNDIPIILLCLDRRTKNDPLLSRLFGLGLYNVLVGQDRSVQKVASLMYKPRTKKEAKAYYQVGAENVGYSASTKNDGVNETEMQNILNHYKKIGDNVSKCVQSFDSINSQYSKAQMKIIVDTLPKNVKVILEENSDSYRKLMGIKGKKAVGTSELRKTEYVEKEIDSGSRLTQPVIIPTAVSAKKLTKAKGNTSETENKIKKLKEKEASELKKKEEEKKAKRKAEAEARRKEEERKAREEAEAEARRKEEERIAKEKAEAEAKRKEEERKTKEKAEAEAKRKEEIRKAKEKAAAEAKAREERLKKERAEAEAKRKEEVRKARAKAAEEAKKREEERKQKELAEEKKKTEKSANKNETDDVVVTKRGRGRPRKNPVVEVSVEDVPVKRKRGRPRKNAVLEEVKTEISDDEELINETDELNEIKGKAVADEVINRADEKDDAFDFNDVDDEEDIFDFDNDDEEDKEDTFEFDNEDEEDDDDTFDFDDEEEDEEDTLDVDDEDKEEDDDDTFDFDDEEEDEGDTLDVDDEDKEDDDDDTFDFDDEEEDEEDTLDLDDEDKEEDDDDTFDFDDEEEDEEDTLDLDDEDKEEDDDDTFDFDNEEEDEEDTLDLDDEGKEEDDDDAFDFDDEEEDEEDTLDLDDEDKEEDDDDTFDFDDEEEGEEDTLDLDDEDKEEDDDDLFDFDDEEEEKEEDTLDLDDGDKKEDDDDDTFDFDDEEDKENEDDTLDYNGNDDEDGDSNSESEETIIQHNGSFKGINNKNYRYDNDLANSIKDLKESEIDNSSYNIDTDNLITSGQKIISFVGTTKNGTSFIVNNLAELYANRGIKTAILDLTKNKNSYYIYTDNDDVLRETAQECLEKLKDGVAQGIEINNNLAVYTSLPGQDHALDDVTSIIKTLLENYSIVLLDCDFDTDVRYFRAAQEMYLIQSLDVLTIQPLTAFLRDLKVKNILDTNKLRIVINKDIKVNLLNEKVLIGGMSVYNDPGMTYMTELFNKETIKYTTIPFENQVYAKYLEGLVDCKITTGGYSKNFMAALNKLADMVYPTINGKKSKNDYSGQNKQFENTFSKNTSSILNRMKKKY